MRRQTRDIMDDDLRLYKQGGFIISDTEGNLTESEYNGESAHNTYKKRREKKEESNMKLKYQALINMLEKQIEFQQKELAKQKESFKKELELKEESWQSERERLKEEQQRHKNNEIQEKQQELKIKESLNQVGEMLSGQVNDCQYLRLAQLKQTQLQIHEYVLLRVYEMYQPYKIQLNQNNQLNIRYQEEIKGLNDRLQRNLNELEHTQKLLQDKDQDHKRYLIDFNNQKQQLEQLLQKKTNELDSYLEGLANKDDLQREARQLKQKNELLEDKVQFLQKELETSRGGNEDKRQLDLLRQDKEYLTRENIQLLEKNKRLEDKYDRLDNELSTSKQKEQEYLHQLLDTKRHVAVDYEQKFNKEFNELKEKHNYELQCSKTNQQEMYERQLRFVQEQKEEHELKSQQLENRLKEKEKEYNQLLLENSGIAQRIDNDMAELRVSYRLKAEELLRVNAMYMEFKDNYQDLEHQLEIKGEKLNTIKNEYYRLELQAKEDKIAMVGQLEVLREKLSDYHNIEKELDKAIEDNGCASYDNLYLHTLQNVPTSKKYRIQQAMELSKRLNMKTDQLLKEQEEKRELEKKVEELKELNEKQGQLLENSNKPYSYLIQNIEEKDKELVKYKQLLNKQDQDYQYMKQELKDQTERVEGLEEDLKRSMLKRDNISAIQQLLLNHLRGGQAKGGEQVVQQIEQLLNNHRGASNIQQSSSLLLQQQQLQPVNIQQQSQYYKTSKTNNNDIPVRDTNVKPPNWASKFKKTFKK